MRIKTIQLSWFRGAADPVSLNLDGKSTVVYGENGSGKSSFVDAVELVLHHGRIGHLAHEYSGKHQEKGLRNTHTPDGHSTEMLITFEHNSELKVLVHPNGSAVTSGSATAEMGEWDYRRTVLRQDEVSTFIHDTKGAKYSALLPLLGLGDLEVAAENLRRLKKTVEKDTSLEGAQHALADIEAKRKTVFGTDTTAQIVERVGQLHALYCHDKGDTLLPFPKCKNLETSLDARIGRFSADQRRHLELKRIAYLDLKKPLDLVRVKNAELAGTADPLIAEKLEILQSSAKLFDKVTDIKELPCPACGRSISRDAFHTHVTTERERLKEVAAVAAARRAAIDSLCDAVRSLQASLSSTDLSLWRAELTAGPLFADVAYLDAIDVATLRPNLQEQDLQKIEAMLLPLVAAAVQISNDAEPDVQQLAADRRVVEAATAVIGALREVVVVARNQALVGFVDSLEQGIRDQIKSQAQSVIRNLSTRMRHFRV